MSSITFWARLERRARDAEMEQSLQAQVRDPLWFLARQWQVGEFRGHDRGSPTQAAIATESTTINAYRPGLEEPGSAPLSASLPLEAHVEREPTTLGARGSVQLGLRFEALLRAEPGFGQTEIEAFRTAYPVAASAPGDTPQSQAEEYRRLAAGRVVDGVALLAAAKQAAPALPANPTVNPANQHATEKALAGFVAYCDSLYSQPEADAAWVAQQLEFQFSLGAGDGATSFDLEASDFGGGHLDWYSFSLGSSPLNASVAAASARNWSFIPNHVSFRGMPQPSWWMFEDGLIDFGKLDTATTDLAKLLVMEFALLYGNDWFELPLRLPVSTLNRIKGLVITDTFGERTLIRPTSAQARADGQPWSMFSLTNATEDTDLLLLAPTLLDVSESEPLEHVLFLRDEMAAMGWAIEKRIQGALDRGVDGYEAWLHWLTTQPVPQPTQPDPSAPPIRYLAGTTVPSNWIPLIPVQNSERTFLFRRGIMGEPGAQPARGRILEPGHPYYIADEAIPRAGAQVKRWFRRVRSSDGTTYVWTARERSSGRGEGSSGLAFDLIEPIIR